MPISNKKRAIKGYRVCADGADRPIQVLRMNIPRDPRAKSLGLQLLKSSLQCLDDSIEICCGTYLGADHQSIRTLLEDSGCTTRNLRLYEADINSLFTQDHAKSVFDENNSPQLLIPKADYSIGISRHCTPQAISDGLGAKIVQSRLFWEGGNILCDGFKIVVGANTIAKNMIRLGLSKMETCSRFEQEFGYPVVVLGDVKLAKCRDAEGDPLGGESLEMGQADFHLDLDVMLLGRIANEPQPVAVIASPEIDKALLEIVLDTNNLFCDYPAPPMDVRSRFQYGIRESAILRQPLLRLYESQLKQAGYRCFWMPDFRIRQHHNDIGQRNYNFNYVNLQPFLSSKNVSSCLYFSYGIEALDSAIENMYQEFGVALVPINKGNSQLANELMQLRGGLHCVTSKMRKSGTDLH